MNIGNKLLHADELEALMRGEKITRTSVGDLLDQEASATPETESGKNDSEETSSDDALPSPA